ncbi:MAG: 4Fe-4S ferredoxin [Deltaproteobacteria bacterium]|nr:4Fe-4S ferredoxin [Deltaproteobacteria bacterium]
MRVRTVEEGRFPHVRVSFLAIPCYHCSDPACIKACPAGAITKRESDGIVLVDREACLGLGGCGSCKEACPYDVPQFAEAENAKMQKCHFCVDRWDKGKKPVCVEACPMRALDAGPMEFLESLYGKSQRAQGFELTDHCSPSVIFKEKDPQTQCGS